MVVNMDSKKAGLNVAYNKKRIFDQMASMHFRLSDEYKRLASIEDAIEIIISVALCGITFLDYQEYFNITIQRPTFIVGCISIFLLVFTLIKQGVGHKELCEKHQIAGKMYSQAKLDIASKIAEWNISDTSTKDILNYIDNRLKHMHQSKVEMSKFLDSHKKDFWVICRLKFRFSRNADEKRDKSDDDSDVR